MKTSQKIEILIKHCFELGQGGWNTEEDRNEYMTRMLKRAKEIGLIKKGEK